MSMCIHAFEGDQEMEIHGAGGAAADCRGELMC